ncbi:MAG: alpha/beta hydrolase [Pseudomonadota bacterium]
MLIALKLLGWGLAAYLAVMAALYFGQARLIYHPDATQVSPGTLGLSRFEEVPVPTEDGQATLVTWRAAPREKRPTLLYFHGNGGTLAARGGRLQALNDAGFGVWIMAYRGYSGSTGRPSATANTTDARTLYNRLISDGVSPHSVFVYGESIGTGVATDLASKVAIGGLILDATFTSLADRAAQLYPWAPVRPFLRENYPVEALIADIDAPLLVMHGARDAVIPSTMGEAVFAAAREPKTLRIFPTGGHSDLFNKGALAEIIAFAAPQTP